ncbi:hypothetical protein C8R44DRAFT_851480 [Mycena epipterygia]|nr:hypothetical protein C8R44DRAFT_851480 [Mycena epipterygia]
MTSPHSHPRLGVCIQKAIQTSIASSRILLKERIVALGVGNVVSRCSEEAIERFWLAGDLGLNMLFLTTVFRSPARERPVGHFGLKRLQTLKALVLSNDTCALVMTHSDLDVGEGLAASVLSDSLRILVGVCFRILDFPQFQEWLGGVLNPIIRAADTAYVSYKDIKLQPVESGLPTLAQPANKRRKLDDGIGRLFSQARRVLQLPGQSSTSTIPLPQTIPYASNEETPVRGALHKILSDVAAFAHRETQSFVSTTFPDGVFTFVFRLPGALFHSALKPTDAQPTEAPAAPVVPVSAPQTAIPPKILLPPPRVKCAPSYRRARAPSPPSPDQRRESLRPSAPPSRRPLQVVQRPNLYLDPSFRSWFRHVPHTQPPLNASPTHKDALNALQPQTRTSSSAPVQPVLPFSAATTRF